MSKREAEDEEPTAAEEEAAAEESPAANKLIEPKSSKKKSSKKAKKAVVEESEDEEDEMEEEEEVEDSKDKKPMKKKALTLTIVRGEEKLGFALNGAYVTSITKGGLAEKAGFMVNDMITEVNGKDTGMNAFGSLLPADKMVPLKMRLIRMVEDTGQPAGKGKAKAKI